MKIITYSKTLLVQGLIDLDILLNNNTEVMFNEILDEFSKERTKKNLSNILKELKLYLNNLQFEMIFNNLHQWCRLENTKIVFVFPMYTNIKTNKCIYHFALNVGKETILKENNKFDIEKYQICN